MSHTTERIIRRWEARYRAVLAVIAGIIFVVAVTAVASGKHGKSASHEVAPMTTTTTVPDTKGIAGFSPVAFTITLSAGGASISHCGLLADTKEKLEKGLMGQKDIGGYVGMIFKFSTPTKASFYMANVPVPLAIAWFDDQGKFVSSDEMAPCTVEASKCRLYNAIGPYRYAVETKAGGLASLGISSGSVLQLGGSGCA